MAEQKRADYASTRPQANGAWIAAVEEGSPAWEAGIEPGMRIERVNGVEPRDLIDWRWEADGAVCELEVFDPSDGSVTPCELWREPGHRLLRRPLRRHPHLRERLPVLLHGDAAARGALDAHATR